MNQTQSITWTGQRELIQIKNPNRIVPEASLQSHSSSEAHTARQAAGVSCPLTVSSAHVDWLPQLLLPFPHHGTHPCHPSELTRRPYFTISYSCAWN